MCLVEDCSKEAYCRGWCPLHYNRWRKWGTTEYVADKPRKGRRQCSIDGCDKLLHTRGYCNTHVRRLDKYGDPLFVGAKRYNGETCQVVENNQICGSPKEAWDLCNKHYNRKKRRGTLEPTKKPERNPNNYIPVKAPSGHPNATSDGFILEHCLVMSNHIGRPLVKGENVHHINGNRHDNRLENLELWSSVQPFGQRVEDKVNYALEILSLYAPEKLRNTNE